MPFRDPELRRAYDRERRRRLRAAEQSGTGIVLSPASRLVVAEGVEALLVEAVTRGSGPEEQPFGNFSEYTRLPDQR